MIKCPYCKDAKVKTMPGLSAHLRNFHPEKWKGTIKATFPEGVKHLGKPSHTWKRKGRWGGKITTTVRNEKKSTREDKPLPDPRGHINFCPNCGYNLQSHALAAGFNP